MILCSLTYNEALKLLLNDKLIKSFKIENYGQYYWELKHYEYARINNSLSYYHHNLTFTIVNKLKTELDFKEYFKVIASAFENALQPYITKSHAKDLIAVYISHPSLKENIYLRLVRVKEFKKKVFKDKIGKIFCDCDNRQKVFESGEIKIELVIYKYESINSL